MLESTILVAREMRRPRWAGHLAVVLVCLFALGAAARASAAPQLPGYWLHDAPLTHRGTAQWSSPVSVQVDTTPSGFVAHTTELVTSFPDWTQGVTDRGPCQDPAPIIPAGTEWARGTLVSPGVYDVTFPFGGFDMIDPDGIGPEPASQCALWPIHARMQLYDYPGPLTQLPAGRPGSLVILGLIEPDGYHPGRSGHTGDGFPGCPYYPPAEPGTEYCSNFPGSLAQEIRDEDGDGLPDRWERRGIRVSGHLVDLPAMGADPRHKDIFLQIDSRPDTAAGPNFLRRIEDVFARAPVPNPDGHPGIALHIDGGRNTVMDPRTGRRWGDLTRAHTDLSIPREFSSWPSGTGPYGCGSDIDWAPFDAVARDHFPEERRSIFRYAIATYYLGVGTGGHCAMGIARSIPGSNFVFATAGAPPGAPIRELSALEIAGNIIHELGHTLGLRHGGFENNNWKPNYLSVMNYLYSVTGWSLPDGTPVFGYSSTNPSSASILDERYVVESSGLAGIAAPPGSQVMATCPLDFNREHPRTVTVGAPYDANCDTTISSTPMSVNFDDFAELGELKTQNDWLNLSYVGGAVGGPGRSPAARGNTSPEPITADQIFALMRAVDSVPPRIRASIRTAHRHRILVMKASDNKAVSGIVVQLTAHRRKVMSAPLSMRLKSPKRFKTKLRLPRRSRHVSVYALDQSSNVSATVRPR